jgi:hypothetical protein
MNPRDVGLTVWIVGQRAALGSPEVIPYLRASAAADLSDLVMLLHDQMQADPEAFAAAWRRQVTAIFAVLTADDADVADLEAWRGFPAPLTELVDRVQATVHSTEHEPASQARLRLGKDRGNNGRLTVRLWRRSSPTLIPRIWLTCAAEGTCRSCAGRAIGARALA